MKKIISTLLFVVGVTALSFAQEANNTALTNGAEDLALSKTSGVYEFTLPDNVTRENVETSAKYYTSVFTVAFDEGSHKATITMINNELKNRYVMTRLLTTCKVKYIKVDGTSYQLYDFIENYL